MKRKKEIWFKEMLLEVEFDEENILISRLINAPLYAYLDDSLAPGSIIGKREMF